MISPRTPSTDDSESESGVPKSVSRFNAPLLGVGAILSERYCLTETLDVGEAATEYRAERIADGKTVAIKVFHEIGRNDRRRFERLQRPTRHAKPLDLPSVFAAVFECAFTDDGRLFLVTELVEGPSLAELLSRGALASFRALEVAMRVGGALEVAVNCGFVDLRLAPHDLVVVESEDRIRLRRSDIAILKRFGLADQLTAAEAPGRDLRYASPTGIEEAPGLPATEADVVYKFGLLLHELLCGKRPFEAATHAELRDLKRRPPKVQIRKGHRVLPPSMDRLVSRMLHPVPGMRPESVTSVLDDLWSAMAHVQATMLNGLGVPAGERAGPLPTRRTWITRWALAGLAALVLGGALLTWFHMGGGGLAVRPRLQTATPRVPNEAPALPVAPPPPEQFSQQESERRQPSDLRALDIAPRRPIPTPLTGGSALEPPRSMSGPAIPGTSKYHRGATEVTPPAPSSVGPPQAPIVVDVPTAQSRSEPGAASTGGRPSLVPRGQVSSAPARPAQPPPDNSRAADPEAIIDWLIKESPRVTE